MREKLLAIYLVSIILGVLTGVMGSFFQIAIDKMNWLLLFWLQFFSKQQGLYVLASVLTSMAMVLLAWLMVKRLAPEAAGSGVQEIEGTLLHERPIYWRRLLPVKFIGGVLAISAKMVLGREGPTIQMGGNLGEMIGEMANVPRHRRDTLIAAGSAAGLATAFNAPLAGVLFVIEEMRNEFNFSFTNFKMVAISCVMATICLHFIIGSEPAIPMDVFQEPGLKSLGWFFLFGLLVGTSGLIFNVFLMYILRQLDNARPWLIPLYVCFIGAIVGLLAVYLPDTVGGGYDIIHEALTLSPGTKYLAALLFIRFCTSVFCYCTGVPGGIFAPMLALGTLLGLVFAKLVVFCGFHLSIAPGVFAVAGMGALFAAAVRAPITGIILVVEMTQNYLLILPLMVSCLTATMVVQLAANPPIYLQLLRRTLTLQGRQTGMLRG